jgi:hypothetical protein
VARGSPFPSSVSTIFMVKAVENVISSVKNPWQFGRLCDTSLVAVPLGTPNTSAELNPWNITDKVSLTVPHSRVSHFSSNCCKSAKQNIKSLCAVKQNIKPKHPFSDSIPVPYRTIPYRTSTILKTNGNFSIEKLPLPVPYRTTPYRTSTMLKDSRQFLNWEIAATGTVPYDSVPYQYDIKD